MPGNLATLTALNRQKYASIVNAIFSTSAYVCTCECSFVSVYARVTVGGALRAGAAAREQFQVRRRLVLRRAGVRARFAMNR